MQQEYKTKIIILNSIKHAENGHIVYAYTENLGRVTYYVNGSKKGRPVVGKNKIILEPLTIIDITGYKSNNSEMHRIKEAGYTFIARDIIFNIKKSTIALFMAEIIYRLVKEPVANDALFKYLEYSINYLDSSSDNIANYHLFFLINIASFLGYMPHDNYDTNYFFDIKRGEFVVLKPNHSFYMEHDNSYFFHKLLASETYKEASEIILRREQRVIVLNNIIDYIGFHHDSVYKISSIKIFSEIF